MEDRQSKGRKKMRKVGISGVDGFGARIDADKDSEFWSDRF
jgi:hypothetical protein